MCVSVCAYVYMCVCVCERERESERARVYVCTCVVCLCIHACFVGLCPVGFCPVGFCLETRFTELTLWLRVGRSQRQNDKKNVDPVVISAVERTAGQRSQTPQQTPPLHPLFSKDAEIAPQGSSTTGKTGLAVPDRLRGWCCMAGLAPEILQNMSDLCLHVRKSALLSTTENAKKGKYRKGREGRGDRETQHHRKV